MYDILSSIMDINNKKIIAIKLRKHGKSYNEISRELKIAKSTLSYWLKEIKLKPKYLKRLYTKQIEFLSRGSKSQKERRAKEISLLVEQARNEIILPLSDDVYKFFGVGLYWAEGSKGNMMQFTNSDPYLILFIVKWLETVFNIKPINLKVHLNIYQQQNEAEIKAFWSDLTGIPIMSFGKSYIKPISKDYKKNNLYFGTIRIYVPKSTDLKYKMAGWLQAFLQSLNTDVELILKRWVSLRNVKRPVNLTGK